MCGRFVEKGFVQDVVRDVSLFNDVAVWAELADYLVRSGEVLFEGCFLLMLLVIFAAAIDWNDYVDDMITFTFWVFLGSVFMYVAATIIMSWIVNRVKNFRSGGRVVFECCDKVIIGTPAVRVNDDDWSMVLEVKDARIIEKGVEVPSFL